MVDAVVVEESEIEHRGQIEDAEEFTGVDICSADRALTRADARLKFRSYQLTSSATVLGLSASVRIGHVELQVGNAVEKLNVSIGQMPG